MQKKAVSGMPAPDFELTDITGKSWHLADFPGDVTLVAPFPPKDRGRAVELAVSARRGDAASGYRLELAADANAWNRIDESR